MDDIKANKDALKHYVIIDPGHGGKDVGTIGKNGSKEIYEKDLNIDLKPFIEVGGLLW